MRLKAAMLASTLFAGLCGLPAAQAQAPDYREVAKLQIDLQKAQAKNDWFGAAVALKSLAKQYKSDPSMLSNTYSQLANVYAPHDARKAAEYRALAQSATAQPAYPAQSVYPPQPGVAPQAVVSPQPTSAMPAPIPMPAAEAPKTSTTDKLTKIFAEAKQIMDQAKQMQKKSKGSTDPQSGQPPPGGFPTGPDGAIAPQPAPAAGVVIGYDANNQPIFAPVPAPADAPVAQGVVIGYDVNNQPIFAPAPSSQSAPPPQSPTPHS